MSSRFALSEPPRADDRADAGGHAPEAGVAVHEPAARRSPPMACIQATLPRMVAISPLWASDQKGWARRQAVVVLVE